MPAVGFAAGVLFDIAERAEDFRCALVLPAHVLAGSLGILLVTPAIRLRRDPALGQVAHDLSPEYVFRNTQRDRQAIADQLGGDDLPECVRRGKQGERDASIWMRKCRRVRDGRRA